MYQIIVAKIVISFILRQIDKFRENTDWSMVRADLHARVALLVPGDWFDDEAQRVADYLLDGVIAVLAAQEDMAQLLQACSEKRWDLALDELQDLLVRCWDTASDEGAEAAKLKILDAPQK